MEYTLVKVIGRYAVHDSKANIQEVWERMTHMFVEPSTSWLRSYYNIRSCQPEAPVRTGSEYEVDGTGGGRYPLIITEWNSEALRFAFRLGSNKNPHDYGPDPFYGDYYGFHIKSEGHYVIIDAEHAFQYMTRRRKEAWSNPDADPVAHFTWVMSGIPVPGKTVFVHPA